MNRNTLLILLILIICIAILIVFIKYAKGVENFGNKLRDVINNLPF